MVDISPVESTTLAEYRLLPRAPKHSGPVDLGCPLVKYRPADGESSIINLNLAVTSAAMQSVSGVQMGSTLPLEGGLAVIFCSQPVEDEADMIRQIKRSKAGFQNQPTAVAPELSVDGVRQVIEKTGYSNIAVTSDGASNGILLGFISTRDVADKPGTDNAGSVMKKFSRAALDAIVKGMMQSAGPEEIIQAVHDYIPYGLAPISQNHANTLLVETSRSFIPIINDDGTLNSMVFFRDLQTHRNYPLAVLDSNQRPLAAAAINTTDYKERVPALVDSEVDIIFVDSSNGLKEHQKSCIEWIISEYEGKVPVVGGNIITRQGFSYLVEAGACAVKIGMGGGSICITQEQKGVGRGQAAAMKEVADARDDYFRETGVYVPLICDGGIVHPRNVAMAYVFGADAVMMGRWFARMEESPTDVEIIRGQKMKPYWGEGSARARKWREQRYGQIGFDEGVEGYVPHAGRMRSNINDLVIKVSATIADAGCSSIMALHNPLDPKPVEVERVSIFSAQEGAVHDILVGSQNEIYRESQWNEK